MNGAESVVRTLVANDVSVCFANPGTSEMHFVAALDRVNALRCVLGLAETVVTAAADGYGRMTGKPAAALVHLGSGYSNAMASLHNARSAQTPLLAIAGDQATFHRHSGTTGSSDIASMARTVSDWVRTSESATQVGADVAAAIQAARSDGGQIASLILPGDVSWEEGACVGPVLPPVPRQQASLSTVQAIARILRSREPALMVLAGQGQSEAGLLAAQRIAAATGAHLCTPAFVPRLARGRGRVPVTRIPYPIDPALKMLGNYRHVILAGAREPASFFAYPGKPRRLLPSDCTTHVLARPDQDVLQILEALGEELQAPSRFEVPQAARMPALAQGPFDPEAFASTLAALLPENAIVVDDAVSSGRSLSEWTHHAAPHDWLMNCGGAIGHALPCSAGAAIADPSRKVVCLQADGAGMYTLQALWTHAREKLDIVTVVFANRKYRILYTELLAVGAQPGPVSEDLFSLTRPELNWQHLAAGMGVESTRVDTLDGFTDAFRAACAQRGPFLIEFLI